ncbi:hypothetical protein XENTR_v10016693 [Xenopus tropicalis]|nr:hypothetical protein XENTR_v10016693 [Xenopus tropicalis]
MNCCQYHCENRAATVASYSDPGLGRHKHRDGMLPRRRQIFKFCYHMEQWGPLPTALYKNFNFGACACIFAWRGIGGHRMGTASGPICYFFIA